MRFLTGPEPLDRLETVRNRIHLSWRIAAVSYSVTLLGCSDAESSPENGAGAAAGPGASGAATGAGGSSAGSGAGASGGLITGGSAGSIAGAGGSSGAPSGGTGGLATPVDCSPIASAGFELCSSAADACGAVFTDGSGCTSVCAAAGLRCESAHENLDGACGADETLPSLPCDSGHQSDYCRCRGPASGGGGAGGGSAGTAGTSGTSGGGGVGGASVVDCNDANDRASLTVARDGSAPFATVQAAIDSLPTSNTTPTRIRIAPGTYPEKLVVNRPFVTLCGRAGQTAATVLTFGDNANTPNGTGGTLGTSGSASTHISASDVSAEHVTFANGTPLGGSQAVALLVTGQRVQFRDCRFLSFQDTLYVRSGTQYFKDCYVEGSVDFIFGGATAVFDGCTVHSAAGGTAITAPNTDVAAPFGLVFLGGRTTAAASVARGSVALGRNWGANGAAAFLGTELGAHVSGVGWVPMGANTLATARFSEYQTTGSGANPGARAADSEQLTATAAAAYTVENILGPWRPSFGP